MGKGIKKRGERRDTSALECKQVLSGEKRCL